jgi:uncharacterized protein (DUF433 family)
MNNFPDIVCTENILAGSPRINGRRLAVGDVVSFIKYYGTFEDIRKDHELSVSEIKQALLYCSTLQCKNDKPKVFCHNCSLRREQEGAPDISNLEVVKTEKGSFIKGDGSIFLGSMNELFEDLNGTDWWPIATDLLIDLRNVFAD